MDAIAKIVAIGMVVLSWASLAAIVGFLGWQMVKRQIKKPRVREK